MMQRATIDIMDEAVAGLLWMHLNIPEDASKAEMETYASNLITQIRVDASQAFIEQEIRILQVQKLCGPVNLNAIANVARRSIAVVRGAAS